MEKPNIFVIESFTIKPPKTVTKLSNLKIITQKPSKIKSYTESKAADCGLQLDIIKKHILPKKCSQRYKTKILYSKMYDEQLNLARLSFKKKLCEIA